MVAMKRAAAAVVSSASAKTPAGKRVKTAEELQIAEVQRTLQRAKIPEAAIEAISLSVPLCLGTARSERHRYQEDMITAIADVLAGIEACSQAEVEKARGLRDEAARDVEHQDNLVRLAHEEHAAKGGILHQCKVGLGAVAETFQQQKSALKQTEQDRELGDQEASVFSQKMIEMEGLLSDMNVLHGTASKVSGFLACLARHVVVDESMKVALTSVLAKEPSTRGTFDTMLFQNLTVKVTAKKDALQEQINTADSSGAARADAVRVAKASFQDAASAQIASADAYRVGMEALASADASMKSAKNGLHQANDKQKVFDASLTEAQTHIDSFRSGPFASLSALRERDVVEPTEEVDVTMAPTTVEELNAQLPQ